MHGNVREAAAWVVERALASSAPADTFLAGARERIDERDHALLNELVRGTLAWLRRIDWVLEAASGRSIEDIDEPLRAPLRLGIYQLLFLDRIPDHAVVHEAVEMARHATHRGGGNFVNAVLRKVARRPSLDGWPVQVEDPVARLAIETSHPTFLVRRWIANFGEEGTREILAANNTPKPLPLLAFRDRGGRELLAESLIEEQVDVVASPLAPLGLLVREGRPLATSSFERGDFYIQDEASQVAALVPPPRPDERIVDLAAAPGGKTFSLLAYEPSARCTVADCSFERMARLRANQRRLRRVVPSVVMDGVRPALRPVFDRVVVDLPCSGTGTLRKHPELRWRLRPEEIGRLADEGAELLAGGSRLVRPGGLLVAITCSIEPEENAELFARFLADDVRFERLDLKGLLPQPWSQGESGPGRWQTLPSDDHDGFTVHVARRR